MGIDPRCLGPAAQRQIAQKLAAQAARNVRESKYHAQPDTRGNIRFDSKKEARRYDDLMLLLKSGKIRNLKLQPQFTLQEAYTTPDGNRVRAIRYVADYSYEQMRPYWKGYEAHCPDDGWYLVVEDVKGGKATQTREYALKKKLLLERFGIEVTEVV
ncbi:MAG: DUF1064 domain-containing protein [Oscillospiraceae bacterium]|nr:DUF1064 domain-containing protein [Oscillospiraceae bacterium]